MKTQNAKLFVLHWIHPRQDAQIVDALRYDLRLSEEEEEFSTWCDEICQHTFPHHIVKRKNTHLDVYNCENPAVEIAIVCAADDSLQQPSGKRWTKDEARIVRRCYPYIDKWPHLLCVLKGRTWEEIEAKAVEIRVHR